MGVLYEGNGELIGWHDPDENRYWIQKNKVRELKDKKMTAKEAVSTYIKDGTLIAMGGFGHVRVSMPIVYEIIRQKKRKLTLTMYKYFLQREKKDKVL